MIIALAMGHEGDGNNNCSWCIWIDHQELGKETGRIGDQRKNQDHPEHSIFKISWNTEKSPRDLRRLAATSTSVKKNTC